MKTILLELLYYFMHSHILAKVINSQYALKIDKITIWELEK